MKFKILKIYYGWFDVELDSEVAITNSDFMGCDAPLLLIKAINNLLKSSSKIEWVAWHGEPDACILRLSANEGILTLELFYSKVDSTKLGYSGEEIAPYIEGEIYSITGSLKGFAEQVLSEFNRYSEGDMLELYEKHWDVFPVKELKELQSLLH